MSSPLKKHHRTSLYVLLGAALAALGAAFMLSFEEIRLLQNPAADLSCNFNLVLNCASVMDTWQASLFFGIPNMFFGLMAFPVIITIAVAALWGGARYDRWLYLAMNAGILGGAIFGYWLFFQSMYVIEVLCPWCLVVTSSCTLLFAANTYITLKENYLKLSKKTNTVVQSFLEKGYYQLFFAAWIVTMVALVFAKYGADLFA